MSRATETADEGEWSTQDGSDDVTLVAIAGAAGQVLTWALDTNYKDPFLCIAIPC
jgi:hypothetical protein